LVPQGPERVFFLFVWQGEREIECLVSVLERERIISVQMWLSRKQEEKLANAKIGHVDFGENVGKTQGVCGKRVPGIGALTGVEACQERERVEILRQKLDEVRLTVAA